MSGVNPYTDAESQASLKSMTALTNDDDRPLAHHNSTDDLVHRVFAHWDMDLHASLGETVPLEIVDAETARSQRGA